MAFSGITVRGSAIEAVSDTSIQVHPGADLTIGKLVVVNCVTDNDSTAIADGPSARHSSVADGKGNSWTKLAEYTDSDGAAADGVTVSSWATKISVAILTTDYITLTVASAVTCKIISVFEAVLGAGGSYMVGALGVGQSAISASVSGMVSREYLLIGHGGAEGTDSSKTPDADYTERFDLVSTSITQHVVTRIATLTADTCTSTTWTNTNPVFLLIALYEVAATTFPTLGVLDNFNRTDAGSPLQGWLGVGEGGLCCASNQCAGATADANTEFLDQVLGADQEGYVTIMVKPSDSQEINILARTDLVNITYYGLIYYRQATVGDKLYLIRFDAGTPVWLTAELLMGQAVQSGDKMGISVVGNQITGYYKPNGGAWGVILGPVTDSTYPTGTHLGLNCHANTIRMDDFGGGTLGATAYKLWGAAGPFALAGQAGRLQAAHLAKAAAGSFTLTGSDARLRAAHLAKAAAGSYGLAGQNALLRATRLLVAAANGLVLTGSDAQLIYTEVGKYGLWTATGAFTLAGADVKLLRKLAILTGAGGYALTDPNAFLLRSARIMTGAGGFALTGANAAFLRRYLALAAAGSLTLTGQSAYLLEKHLALAMAGSFALTGANATLLSKRLARAAAGSFALAGMDAILTYTVVGVYKLLASVGAFSLANPGATSLADRQLRAIAGSILAESGGSTEIAARKLMAAAGSLLMTGSSATLAYVQLMHYLLQAGAGAFALMDNNAHLLGLRKVFTIAGGFALTGSNAYLLNNYIYPVGLFRHTEQDIADKWKSLAALLNGGI